MTATPPFAVATVLMALALAGCTGSFNVDQTEPIRVQLEGAPETVTVRETDTEAQRVEIATCGEAEVDACDVEEVDVQVEVEPIASGPCKILVTIQGEDGSTLLTKVIDVSAPDQGDGDATASSSTTATGNGTGNGTASASATATAEPTASSGQTVIQNLVVNVRGNKNIVVVTQAQEGAADVNIQAIKASGNSNVDADQDSDGTVTATSTASATMTATSSPTNSTTTTTSSGP